MAPPLGPDLNLVKDWKLADFIATMRTGIDPNGHEPDGRALLRFGADRVRGGDRHANLGAGHRLAQRWTVELTTNQRSACER